MSYKGVIFLIEITMILLVKSELQKRRAYYPDESSYYKEDGSYSSHTTPHISDYDMPIQKSKNAASKRTMHFLTPEILLNPPQESVYTHYRSSSLKPPKSQQGSAECPPLRKTLLRELVLILSPDIVSLVDPFRYLVDKVLKISKGNIAVVRKSLNRQLDLNRLPACYIPYATALSSLLWCGRDFGRTSFIIREIQKLPTQSNNNYSFLRSYIDSSTSPELFELSSDDILSDPKPPTRLLYKLLDMPERNIQNLQTQLKNFLEKWNKQDFILPGSREHYIGYADSLLRFLQEDCDIETLKSDVSPIRQMAMSDEHVVPDTPLNSSTMQVEDEIVANQ